jgi:16S rRNA (uracil1498-N3)-methyltransferase
MRLTRVYVDAALSPGSSVELSRDTAAHVAKVLRARSGDELVLFNGDGQEFTGVIEAVRGSRVTAVIGAARTVNRESPIKIALVQCVPRGDRMDFIVQKSTELGVARIVPVLSQRSVVKLDDSQAASKQAHWHAVAASACEQCGRNRLPGVEAPQPLLKFLGSLPDREPSALRLVLEPDRDDGWRGDSLDAGITSSKIANIDIAIGPEGGFAPEELDALQLSHYVRVALGPRVLRTETAAIAALVMLQCRFGDMSANSD